MKIKTEEILHMAKLAHLNIEDSEIEKYKENLEDILNFAEIVNNAPVEGLDITVGSNQGVNRFRQDKVEVFEDNESLLANAITKEQNMFKLPKTIN